jgi:hypothetical protein
MTAAPDWYPANSADDTHDDLEADLCPLGCPGRAVWAWVADEGGGTWSWSIYARWLWEDIDADPDRHTLAEDQVTTQEQAKAAVATWVAQAQAEAREYELDLVRLGSDAG